MKQLYLTCFGILTVASLFVYYSQPGVRRDIPVLYWVTDANPARAQQVDLFHRWLEKHDYPRFELRVDTANRDVAKMMIQGVSGVGGDIMDISPGVGIRYFHAMGLLADITDAGRMLGFDPSQTYASMEPSIVIDGRQYSFPCNVFTHHLWVNKATFEKHGQPPPPQHWDFATFERLGRQFVEAANPPGKRRTVFFLNEMPTGILQRSVGLDVFNETLTHCVLDDPRNSEMLKLKHKWIYEDRLLPSEAEIASFAAEAGYGGAAMQLFNNGNYAMFFSGRYALIQLRQFGPLKLAVSDPPHGEFPNTSSGTRAAAIYAGSRHKELAKYFLAFLASEDYNMLIVEDADALPPAPKFTKSERFLRPPAQPNEWGTHEVFVEAAQTIAIGSSYSPFVLNSVVARITRSTESGFMSGVHTAEQAGRQAADRVNDEIRRNLRENPDLQPLYEHLVQRQKTIDEYRTAGRKVPMAWIENPFHRRYYAFKGWAED